MAGLPSILTNFHPVWLAALVTILFASLARVMRGVSMSGAVAGGLVCFVLYACAGLDAFLLLVLLFVLTWGATRFGYQRKQRLGTAEKKEGRTASQVFANVGVAASCAAAYRWHGNSTFVLAMCAALAEAAADTVSSEIGQTSNGEARLITTWRKVPAGTDGGVSLAGTAAGAGAALLLSSAAVLTGLINAQQLLASFTAAFLGTVCDSYLGAALESRKVLNNNLVNFLGTLSAVLVITITQLTF
jgi:uncharacterized protein (TIGR00297 family)